MLPEPAIRIVEVGPRDGLQNEKQPVSTQDKAHFIHDLAAAGVQEIEATSFVSPQAIPQLGDAEALMALLAQDASLKHVHFSALTPNMRGLEGAIRAGLREVAVFVATSDAFSKRNIRATVEESFQRIGPVVEQALAQGMRVRGYLSTVFGCPYEGEMDLHKAVALTQRLLEMGCYEVSLGDTIGVAKPEQVAELLDLLKAAGVRFDQLALHFHDTQKRAIANIEVALDRGITRFDASAGGLGGCPYAEGASGNVATEDVVALMQRRGLATGIDLKKLVAASTRMLALLGRESSSPNHQALREGAAHAGEALRAEGRETQR